jgi:hypothetical protein
MLTNICGLISQEILTTMILGRSVLIGDRFLKIFDFEKAIQKCILAKK